MPDLLACLLARTILELRAVSARLGIQKRTTRTKQDWALDLADFWRSHPRRLAVLHHLSPQARTALHRLLHFDSIPRPLFLAEFGDLRPARSPTPYALPPWRLPLTPSEELAYAGLLYGCDRHPLHKTRAFLLPAELRPYLAGWLAQAPTSPPPPVPPAPEDAGAALLHDLAELLAALHRCHQLDRPLAAGRWLPADDLRLLNHALLLPEPQPLPRSHKRTKRLRCLMFWATAADLHHQGILTPAGWQWLDLPPAQQLNSLWQGWRTAPTSLRTAYALPDAVLPQPWPELFWQTLRSLPAHWTAIAAAAHLLATPTVPAAYWLAHLEHTATLAAIVDDLCRGPLAHFGLVTWTLAPGDSACRYSLSPLGQALLNDSPLPDIAPPAQPAAWREEDDALIVERPAALVTHAIPVLAACAQQATLLPGEQGARHLYHLTPSSLHRAAQHGLTQPLLLAALQTFGILLPPQPAQALHDWLLLPAAVDVDLVTLLRTPDPALLASLHAAKDISAHLQSIISPTAAVVDLAPSAARALLQQHGYPARTPALPPARQFAGQDAEAAAAWLAGQLYELLRQFLPLPLAAPYAAMAEALARLSPEQQAVLSAWRSQLAQDLLDLVDGRTFTPPPQPSDPARWRPILQAAMDTGQWLDMLYFSPARNLPTRRRIQPAWFSQRPGPDYLLAYCQEAGAVLTFRLDRIQSLHPLALETQPGTQPGDSHTTSNAL